jgi:hypothetical protein
LHRHFREENSQIQSFRKDVSEIYEPVESGLSQGLESHRKGVALFRPSLQEEEESIEAPRFRE